jgi:hypothetical protein
MYTKGVELKDAIIGVIGTILGTILGWILSSVSNKGKLNVYISSWKDSFQYNETGSMVPSSSIEQTECYSYRLALDIYNSSGESKIMRNITIVFNDTKSDIFKSVPKDDDTRKNNGPIPFYDDILPVNIPPKTVIHLKLRDVSWKQNSGLDYIWNTKRIYMTYIDDRNRVKRITVKPEDYSDYFNSHTVKSS